MIIVLVGSIGSGKTTAADYLKSHFDFEETSFADPIKKFALALGFDEKEVYGTQEEKAKVNPCWGISGRQFMQRFGTEIMREHSKVLGEDINNVWIKAVECKMQITKKNLVISDGRFEDEIAAVRKHGGFVVKLTRKSQYESAHESEKNFDKIKGDFEYENSGTKEDLYNFLHNLFTIINAHRL